MIKYSWITDIHLDHLRSEKQFIDFCHNVVANEPTGIFITGDISDAKNIVYHLSAFEKIVQRPVYYVLGNHDYYSGDIESVRKSMRELTNVSAYLKYAQLTGYHVLSPKTALVGHDGWYDGLNGNANRSRFMMNDWIMIRDYIQHSGGQRFLAEGNIKDKPGLIAFSQKLAREGVIHVMNGIKSAAKYHKNIVVLTHFPPFPEAHIYHGEIGDSDAQPWFTSKLMGDMLLQAASTYPNIKFTVLCGHTHGKADYSPSPNLRVFVGKAEYGDPTLAGLIDIE